MVESVVEGCVVGRGVWWWGVWWGGVCGGGVCGGERCGGEVWGEGGVVGSVEEGCGVWTETSWTCIEYVFAMGYYIHLW